MKVWFKIILTSIICIGIVGTIYIVKFGWPSFVTKDQRYMESIYEIILDNINKYNEVNTDDFGIKLDDKKIYIYLVENPNNSINFISENLAISSTIVEANYSQDFINMAIKFMFEAIAVNNGYNVDNATYSLLPDIISDKKVNIDGYQLTSQNGISNFYVYANKTLNLAQKSEVYIKESDISGISDILKSKLQYKLIEKPGIILEKNISYSKNLVFVIYEVDKLTDRTYNSLLSVLSTITNNSSYVEYIKENYPKITNEGVISLNGITISLNEGLGDGNISYYENPNNYKYMLIKINTDKLVTN